MTYRESDIIKIAENSNENLNEIKDKVDLLQKSQVYVHNHIDEVETRIDTKIDGRLRVITDVLKVLLQHQRGG